MDFSLIKNLIRGTKFENNTFLVGGCVRDEIMGKQPKDYDIVVSLPNGGIDLAIYLTQKTNCYKPDTNPVIYPTYGTAKFEIRTDPQLKGVELEAVQTRKEEYRDINSRNPQTQFGTLEDDAFRRDLTINALYKNISTNEIIDPTGMGMSDIKNHVIKTTDTPDIIFQDDPLRMLRVIRFATRYGWNIDKNALNGIKNNSERINIISKERIQTELNSLLLMQKPSYAFNLLHTTGLLKQILPDLYSNVGLQQNKYHIHDVWGHTMAVLDQSSPSLINRLAALLHDVGKYNTQTVNDKGNTQFIGHEAVSGDLASKILTNLKYPNDIIKKVSNVIKNHMRTKDWGNENLTTKDKNIRKLQYNMGTDLEDLLDLIDADNKSHHPDHNLIHQVNNIRKKLDDFKQQGINCDNIKLPINGNDVMQHFNITGKNVGKIITHIIDMYIKDPIKYQNKENCLKQANSFYKSLISQQENRQPNRAEKSYPRNNFKEQAEKTLLLMERVNKVKIN